MARILAISSQVARGHVGLSAVVPSLHALGHEVVALPTILLSYHPGHPYATGEHVPPDVLARMLDALARNGWLTDLDAVVTGYLPSAAHVDFAAYAIDRTRYSAPRTIVFCDAILGDLPKGLYIDADAAAAIRERLVPQADILKGNAFEIGWLAGVEIAGSEMLAMTARRRGWHEVIATSVRSGGRAKLSNLWVGEAAPTRVDVEELRGVPKGTGDLLSGLLIGHLLADARPLVDAVRSTVLARAVGDLGRVIEASVGRDELQLIATLGALRPPPRRSP